MLSKLRSLTACAVLVGAMQTLNAQSVTWPGGAKVAVSLSYDDALHSQLDNAVPVLDKYQIKASFYPLLASQVVADRLEEWRQLAKNGHELGNHTLFHPCSASQPGRDWVKPHHDMDKRSLEQMREEIVTANTVLQAIDGKNERTFTPPCLDYNTAEGSYLPTIKPYFVAIKGAEGFPPAFATLLLPNGQNGKQLIEFVENSAESAKLIHIIFHGIGADHLSVSKEAHEELVAFLAKNREVYWTDTYINIMRFYNTAIKSAGDMPLNDAPIKTQ